MSNSNVASQNVLQPPLKEEQLNQLRTIKARDESPQNAKKCARYWSREHPKEDYVEARIDSEDGLILISPKLRHKVSFTHARYRKGDEELQVAAYILSLFDFGYEPELLEMLRESSFKSPPLFRKSAVDA